MSHHTSVGEKHVLNLGDDKPSRKIILYNPLPRQRTKVQTLIVSTPFVRVTDRKGQAVKCQVSPVWIGPAALSAARYELSFLVNVPGFGITTYIVHVLHRPSYTKDLYLANVTIFNTDISFPSIPGFNHLTILPHTQEFSISQRPELSASFGKSGLLKALFLPDKPEPDVVFMDSRAIIHLVTGPILSKVFIELPHVRHTCTLFNSPGSDGLGLHIFNEVDITETQNYELAMRFNTDIASGDQFFTDLNGLNIIRRQRFPKLPTQGNYYPMAASAYIEDKRVRLTIVTAQPLGVASMASGQLEIMQDRRLLQDDNRGLGQGVMDNLLTNHMFALIVEKKEINCPFTIPTNHPAGLLSLNGHLASEELLHPVMALHIHNSLPFNLHAHFAPLRYDLPVDLSIVSLRVFPIPEGAGKGIGMVLHQAALDACFNNSLSRHFNVSESGEVELTKLLNDMEDWTISKAPLTFHNVGPSLKSPVVHLCPHQLLSILFHKTQS